MTKLNSNDDKRQVCHAVLYVERVQVGKPGRSLRKDLILVHVNIRQTLVDSVGAYEELVQCTNGSCLGLLLGGNPIYDMVYARLSLLWR